MTSFYITDPDNHAPLFYSHHALETMRRLFKLAPPVGDTPCTLTVNNDDIVTIRPDTVSFEDNAQTVMTLLKLLVACVEQSSAPMPPEVVEMRRMEERVRSLEARHEEDEKQTGVIRNLLWEWLDEEDKSVADGITRLLRQHKFTYENMMVRSRENSELSARLKTLERKVDLLENAHLTPREFEVLALMAEGLNNKDITSRLFISLHTVKSHVAAIYYKFGLKLHNSSRVLAVCRYLKEDQINQEATR